MHLNGLLNIMLHFIAQIQLSVNHKWMLRKEGCEEESKRQGERGVR